MIRSVLKILLSLVALCSLTAQNVKIEGVKNLLAKEEKFDNLALYLTLGKPSALKIYASANSKILLYKDNPLHAEAVNSVTYDTQDKCWQILNPQTSCGYLIQETGQLNRYIYLLDYKDYAFEPQNLQVREQGLDPCRRIILSWSGAVKPMLYYGSTAVPKKLKREIELKYKSLKYSDKEHKFFPEEVMEKVEIEGNSYEMTASLTDTPYTFARDKWQKAFALQMPNVSSPIYTSNRLEVHSFVKILDEEGKDVPKDDWTLLSAPVNLELKAVGNKSDEQRFRWQIKQRKNGDKEGRVILDYTGQETDYTLDEAGYYEVSMVAFGANGTCSDNSFVQELRVQESKLEVPNAQLRQEVRV